MKIVKLQAENIKKLVAVEITPHGNVVKITGRNAQGKSSVLDAIWMALGGKQAAPDEPVRRGAEKGRVRLDLGDIIVERRFTEGGSSLIVESKDGARFQSPQTLLDGLVGRLSFDPCAFMRMDPKHQFDTVRELVGLDFTALDKARGSYYEQRTEVNRDIKRQQARVDAITVPDDAPDAEDNATELLNEINQAIHTNQTNESNRQAVRSKRVRAQELKRQIETLQAECNAIVEEGTQLSDRLAITPDIDIVPLQARLETIESRNKAARAKAERRAIDDNLKELRESERTLTARIEDIDSQKKWALESADFPLSGMSFVDDVVTYNGMPLAQASSAEQLRVSLAMAMALNPKIRVIHIKDGSLLDPDSMKVIEELARDKDYQVWCEIVDTTGKVGVFIEDGQVVAVDGVAA